MHLVGELGFSLDDRYLKRAGLDYWPSVILHRHVSIEDWLVSLADARLWLFSARRGRRYTDVGYRVDDRLVFGRESVGLPADLQDRLSSRLVQIPHNDNIRSLNVANAASVALYEAIRQLAP